MFSKEGMRKGIEQIGLANNVASPCAWCPNASGRSFRAFQHLHYLEPQVTLWLYTEDLLLLGGFIVGVGCILSTLSWIRGLKVNPRENGTRDTESAICRYGQAREKRVVHVAGHAQSFTSADSDTTGDGLEASADKLWTGHS